MEEPSRKCWSSGSTHHQMMRPGNPQAYFNNFCTCSLEDKDVFEGRGHVRIRS
jgi:hypothetical protein